MSRKIEYINTGANQFVYEIPSQSPDKSKLYVSFKKIDDIFDLLRSCDLISSDNDLDDMSLSNTIYLDTITNKHKIYKKQTRFLLAPILPKLKESGIKYVVLFPSIMEGYMIEHGYPSAFAKIGEEFKETGYNEEAFMVKLLERRKALATKVYEPLGFKSYDTCPGYLPDSWELNPDLNGGTYGLNKNQSYEKITMIDDRNGELKYLLIPSQYWMIAKVQDLHKKLLSECFNEQIKKSKETGFKIIEETKQGSNKIFEKIDTLIKSINIINFTNTVKEIHELIRLNKEEISKIFIDSEFTDLMNYAREIESGEISANSLTKCLNMVKESEDKEQWILKGGSATGFYINQISEYKNLYYKYKTKYLQTKML